MSSCSQVESVFEWLLLVDPCRSQSLTKAIRLVISRRFCLADGGTIHDLCKALESFDEGAYTGRNLPSPFCMCTAPCPTPPAESALPAMPLVVSPIPPRDANGFLLVHSNWYLDHYEGAGVLTWVARRICEYFTHTCWPKPYAAFPGPTRSESIKRKRVLRRNRQKPSSAPNVFDSRGNQPQPGNWMRLVDYKPPIHEASSSGRSRWLPFFYREPLPDNVQDKFPPLNCALSTIHLSLSIRHIGAALQPFEQCTVEAMVNDMDHRPLTFKDINGITVLFLSRSSLWLSSRLLAAKETGGIICRDLLAHKDVLGSGYDQDVLREALSLLFSRSSEFRSTFALPELCQHISQIIEIHLCRQSSQRFFSSSSLPCTDILKEAFQIFTPHLLKDGQRRRHAKTVPYQPEPAEPLWLRYAGLFYGCAVGTVFQMFWDHCTKEMDKARRKELLLEWSTNIMDIVWHVIGLEDQISAMSGPSIAMKWSFDGACDESLTKMTLSVQGSIASSLKSYENLVDDQLFHRLFRGGFKNTVRSEVDREWEIKQLATPQDVLGIFGFPEAWESDSDPIVPYEELRYIGDTFFSELSRVEVVSPRPRYEDDTHNKPATERREDPQDEHPTEGAARSSLSDDTSWQTKSPLGQQGQDRGWEQSWDGLQPAVSDTNIPALPSPLGDSSRHAEIDHRQRDQEVKLLRRSGSDPAETSNDTTIPAIPLSYGTEAGEDHQESERGSDEPQVAPGDPAHPLQLILGPPAAPPVASTLSQFRTHKQPDGSVTAPSDGPTQSSRPVRMLQPMAAFTEAKTTSKAPSTPHHWVLTSRQMTMIMSTLVVLLVAHWFAAVTPSNDVPVLLPDLPLSAARVRAPSAGRSPFQAQQQDVVCIVDSPDDGWYRVLDIHGDLGVRALLR